MSYSKEANQGKYPFILPDLPFDKKGFTPYFTEETFDYHHGKHHQAYVTNLNNLLNDKDEYKSSDLEQIIAKSYGKDNAVFNNAAQIWNHSFFWHSIKPQGGGLPKQELLQIIERDFGSFDNFVSAFKTAAVSQFGSGWAWLVSDNGKLKITQSSNADTPITKGLKPLIACDVWEHAYYIDYRNKRPDYVTTYIEKMINWDFAQSNLRNI